MVRRSVTVMVLNYINHKSVLHVKMSNGLIYSEDDQVNSFWGFCVIVKVPPVEAVA